MRFRTLIVLALGLSSAAVAQNPVGSLLSSDAKVRGAVELAAGGARVMSGSYVSAGNSPALLRLDRGGEVRVCAGTSLSVATSQSGRDLMLGLSAGCIETHFTVSASADSVITPDFRILLAGPGRFDFAIEAGKGGETCIRALPGNSSSLIVSELMGDGTYQVKPAERLVFHNGRLQDPDHENANCGCTDASSVMVAEEKKVEPTAAQPAASPPPESKEPKSELPVHVEVEAPFVFRADDPGPSPLEEAISLRVAKDPLSLVALAPPAFEARATTPTVVDKPVNKPKPTRFFGRVKAFFASIFR